MPLRVPFAPEAVVFDLDGLLVDTEPLWERAERRLVDQLGGTFDPDLRQRLLGSGLERASRLLADALNADPTMVQRRMTTLTLEEFRRGVPTRPGARELLEALHGRLPTAIATNSQRVVADTALMVAELEGFVDHLVCAEDVAEAKPAPDPYRHACELLGVDPERTVGFEDSSTGVASAVAAGLWVVACPSVPGAGTDGAHAVLGSLTEVDPDELLGGVP